MMSMILKGRPPSLLAFMVAFGLGVLCCNVPAAATGVADGPHFNPANRHVYYLLDSTTWTASAAEAVAMGGYLVTIDDQAENDWVYDIFDGQLRNLWIGLNDAALEGTFVWHDGASPAYTNWLPVEPDNWQDQDYGFMISASFISPNPDAYPVIPGHWGDTNNSSIVGTVAQQPLYAVVEIVPALGDLDHDGDIDNADLGKAAGNYSGSSGTGMSYFDGDIDGDGDVDNADIGFIAGAFTGAMASGSPLPTVPEPASLSLLALGGLALLRRKGR